MSWFEACFADLPDPRTGNATRHDLLEVLTIALTASIRGAQMGTQFADFAVDREDLFREFLELEHGLPSHDTFSRIFRLLDPEAFEASFQQFLDALGARDSGVVAIDGKTLRRSYDAAAARSPLEAVTAFAADGGLVVGQRRFRSGQGESEIVEARELLTCLDLNGVLVTGDAIHCQDATAATIIEGGGDYLLALKDNRPALHAEVASAFETIEAELDVYETTEDGHGRLEVRRHWVTHELDWLTGPRHAAGLPEIPPGVACLGMVEAVVTREGQTSRTRRYYLSSAPLTAKCFALAVRAHRRIENRACTGCSTRASTRTRPATASATAPTTLQSYGNSRSTFCTPQAPTSLSPASVNAVVGPTPSHAASLVKCNSPEPVLAAGCTDRVAILK